jgi:hypothetical protein
VGSAQLDGLRRHSRARHRPALLFADASPAFVPVIGMVGGVAGMALANHERLKQRVEALESAKRRRNGAAGSVVPVDPKLSYAAPTRIIQPILTTNLPRLRMFISGPLCVI